MYPSKGLVIFVKDDNGMVLAISSIFLDIMAFQPRYKIEVPMVLNNTRIRKQMAIFFLMASFIMSILA
jgi:hypothetical protein